MIYPVLNPRITSGFGWRDTTKSFHSGIDFGPKVVGEKGDTIVAVDDGAVVKVGNDPKGYGIYIVIQHKGYCTLYAHLDKAIVKVSDRVYTGQAIASMGNTGHCIGSGKYPGTHLHFENRECVYDSNFFKNESDGRKWKAKAPIFSATSPIEQPKPQEPTNVSTEQKEVVKQPTELDKAIEWAKETGASDCTRLTESATRQEVIVMLYRALKGGK